jgi:hypothetical protein
MPQFASEYPDGVTAKNLKDSPAEIERQLHPLEE